MIMNDRVSLVVGRRLAMTSSIKYNFGKQDTEHGFVRAADFAIGASLVYSLKRMISLTLT